MRCAGIPGVGDQIIRKVINKDPGSIDGIIRSTINKGRLKRKDNSLILELVK